MFANHRRVDDDRRDDGLIRNGIARCEDGAGRWSGKDFGDYRL